MNAPILTREGTVLKEGLLPLVKFPNFKKITELGQSQATSLPSCLRWPADTPEAEAAGRGKDPPFLISFFLLYCFFGEKMATFHKVPRFHSFVIVNTMFISLASHFIISLLSSYVNFSFLLSPL